MFVLEGDPDVWIDGHLHQSRPGDAVASPAGTGICHTFMNNTGDEVRLLVVGESSKPDNRVRYPRNEAYEATRRDRGTGLGVRQDHMLVVLMSRPSNQRELAIIPARRVNARENRMPATGWKPPPAALAELLLG